VVFWRARKSEQSKGQKHGNYNSHLSAPIRLRPLFGATGRSTPTSALDSLASKELQTSTFFCPCNGGMSMYCCKSAIWTNG
jgi:hypothetical protein